MRIVLIGGASADLAPSLARVLRVPELIGEEQAAGTVAATDGFVLHGFPRTVAEAQALDRVLGARAASIETALWVRGAVVPADEDALLEHYRGRVVELDGQGTIDELRERALDAVREAAPALAG